MCPGQVPSLPGRMPGSAEGSTKRPLIKLQLPQTVEQVGEKVGEYYKRHTSLPGTWSLSKFIGPEPAGPGIDWMRNASMELKVGSSLETGEAEAPWDGDKQVQAGKATIESNQAPTEQIGTPSETKAMHDRVFGGTPSDRSSITANVRRGRYLQTESQHLAWIGRQWQRHFRRIGDDIVTLEDAQRLRPCVTQRIPDIPEERQDDFIQRIVQAGNMVWHNTTTWWTCCEWTKDD